MILHVRKRFTSIDSNTVETWCGSIEGATMAPDLGTMRTLGLFTRRPERVCAGCRAAIVEHELTSPAERAKARLCTGADSALVMSTLVAELLK